MEPLKPGNSPGSGPEVVERESAKSERRKNICRRDCGKRKKRRIGQSGMDRARVRKEKRREMVDLLVLPRTAVSLQNGAGSSE